MVKPVHHKTDLVLYISFERIVQSFLESAICSRVWWLILCCQFNGPCAVGCGGSFWIPRHISCDCSRNSSLQQPLWLQSGWICTSWHLGAIWTACLHRQWLSRANSSVFLHFTNKWWSMDHNILQRPKQVWSNSQELSFFLSRSAHVQIVWANKHYLKMNLS